jgi:hypothetical protein
VLWDSWDEVFVWQKNLGIGCFLLSSGWRCVPMLCVMQPIHIARDGNSLGRFTAEDVAEGLRDGKFFATDLAWQDPMTEWVPLSEFPGLPAVAPIPARVISPQPALPVEPAWEKREELGWLRALTETVAALLGRPQTVFPSMPQTGGYWGPLWFLLITGTLSGWVAVVYQYVIVKVNPESLGDAFKTVPGVTLDAIFAVFCVLLPLGLVIGALVTCGLYHVALMLLSKTPVKFETTFRVYCYAWGAASVFQLLPMCGGYIYPFFAIYLTILGFRDAQKASTPVAVCAVLLPMLLCCGLAMLMGFGAAAAGAASGASGN